MSEVITLVIVVGASALAVGLLVALNAFMGGWTRARLPSLEAAAERIILDVMDFQPSNQGVLDSDRLSALVLDQVSERLGLAVCRGDGVAVRALRKGELGDVQVQGLELVLQLDDYTLPSVTLRLGSVEAAEQWQQTLTEFMTEMNQDKAHA